MQSNVCVIVTAFSVISGPVCGGLVGLCGYFLDGFRVHSLSLCKLYVSMEIHVLFSK